LGKDGTGCAVIDPQPEVACFLHSQWMVVPLVVVDDRPVPSPVDCAPGVGAPGAGARVALLEGPSGGFPMPPAPDPIFGSAVSVAAKANPVATKKSAPETIGKRRKRMACLRFDFALSIRDFDGSS